MRDCTFSSARPGGAAREHVGEHRLERLVRGLDRHHQRGDAEIGGDGLGIGDAVITREPRRHQHAGHVLGTERVDGDRRDDRGVDPAREPDVHVGEAVLAHVVARTEHQGFVDLAHRGQNRLDARGRTMFREVRLRHDDFRERRRTGPAARIEQPFPERGAYVEVDDEQVFFELLRRATSSPWASITSEPPSNTSSS